VSAASKYSHIQTVLTLNTDKRIYKITKSQNHNIAKLQKHVNYQYLSMKSTILTFLLKRAAGGARNPNHVD